MTFVCISLSGKKFLHCIIAGLSAVGECNVHDLNEMYMDFYYVSLLHAEKDVFLT